MMTIFKGAPFDSGNLWNTPAVDGGKLLYSQTGTFSNIEGGIFTVKPPKYYDGGHLPAPGTSSYSPNPDNGPNGPNIIEDTNG